METINIKGKEYVTVNERLKAFRNNFKDYSLTTEIIELGADYCTMKATITDDKGVVRSTGFAREVVAKSPINKFAFVENCETSAVGRCLGNFGIGIDTAVCTADELLMKLSQDSEKTSVDEYIAKIKSATSVNQLNSLYYKWSSDYAKGTPEFRKLNELSGAVKLQLQNPDLTVTIEEKAQ